MSNIAAFIDFKAGKISSRSSQVINFVNDLSKHFDVVKHVYFYTFDKVTSCDVLTAIPSTLIQIKGISDAGIISNSQLSDLHSSLSVNNCTSVIGFKSTALDHIMAFLAVQLKIPMITQANAIDLKENHLLIRQSIFSGKATSCINVNLSSIVLLNPAFEHKVYDLCTNQIEIKEMELPSLLPFTIQSINNQTQGASLVDASYVVGAGRGLKDPSNWNIIEDLAFKIGAATACSKPVSDINWRPHSEHVGQTGIKIAPKLYIACGISGAIQHLAGVNGSKIIIVINNDPEAPFFKYADYGIVGDVFDIVPEIVKNL